MATSIFKVGAGLFNTGLTDIPSNSPMRFGWISGDIPSSGVITGHDPITLFLRFLISTGNADNYSGSGTNYDAYAHGVGLGIPYQRVDVAGCEAIRDAPAWDDTARVILLSEKGLPSKKTIVKELCRPFGLYPYTTNAGLISLRRPLNPEKYYINAACDSVKVKVASGGTTYSGTLSTGVYNRTEMAAELQSALNTATSDSSWTVTYNTGTNKLQITHAGAADWDLIASDDDGWDVLGFSSTTTGQSDGVALAADDTTALFSGRTLTEDDLWDVRPLNSSELQHTSVLYQYDWTPDTNSKSYSPFYEGVVEIEEGFQRQRLYISSEDVNLGGDLLDQMYVIQSKGLVSSDGDTNGLDASTWGMFHEPSSGCDPEFQGPAQSGAVEADSITKLVPATILDRYRQPPPLFAAKLKWEHNDLEVGETIQLTYNPDGVILDREKRATTTTTRTFELIKVSPAWNRGHVQVVALGHRANDTPSVSVTAKGN